MTVGQSLAMVRALMRRAVNEVVRVPGAAIPAVIAPTIFMLGITSVFGKLAILPGFTTDSYMTFVIAISMLQAAGFTGAATGVNLARDIELGWFDRLLACPAPRWAILLGTVLSASMRALMPITLLLIVGLAIGVDFPGLDGLVLAIVFAACFSAVIALYSVTLALRFRTQAAAPLMQAGTFMAVLFTTSYAPLELLTGWLHDVASVNPVTHVVEGVRQGFVANVTWAETWPALLALAGLAAALGSLALRGMARTSG
ncbi:MAG TPA: ABC transporter permease [Thermoleophilaceae bacterium]|nr:ABC transporter permease [Thermoleophilaceae bacterium]